MRILHVESGRHLYGGARQVLILADGLRQMGIENRIACDPDSAIFSAVRASERVAVSMRGDLDLLLVLRLRRLIRGLQPDVVHLHSRRGADWAGTIAARKFNMPLVISRRVDNPEPALLARIKYRQADRIIAISNCIREVVLQTGIEAGKVVLVHSAAPPCEYPPRNRDWIASEFGVSPGSPLIGVIAQLIPRKGHRFLLEALPKILQQAAEARVLFLGQGPARDELERHARSLGLVDHVVFAGFRHDLPTILPNLDMLVHPALREGLGVAVLQACQARLPVVASRAGGVPEIIINGETGLLIPPSDSAALADAVLRLIGDPALASRLANQAQRHVASSFGAKRMVDAHMQIYRDLTSQ